MPAADRFVYQRPDDPYTTTVVYDAAGWHIVISADVLTGGSDADLADVRAEAERRARLLHDHFAAFLHHD